MIEHNNINLVIVDTCGQEKYISILKSYFIDAHACIFIYDVTKRSSFNSLKDLWINFVTKNTKPNVSK